ncbi:FG-GAP repeat protein [Chitinophaga sp. CF418]
MEFAGDINGDGFSDIIVLPSRMAARYSVRK